MQALDPEQILNDVNNSAIRMEYIIFIFRRLVKRTKDSTATYSSRNTFDCIITTQRSAVIKQEHCKNCNMDIPCHATYEEQAV